ncbi:MAG: GIY-YIG nuclease family protein [Melioribacteraceae bacterium]|nr:GIY-YIG nuclease family protein [Melioribacteraceae bacterium]MCF8420544.1 GIY-YIG nuclease family protein [Melioribacteraceae bacterium]
MNYNLYILYSENHKRTYTGQTNNLRDRLKRHNLGKVKSTKPYIPWELIYTEIHATRSEVIKREKWIKTPSGREEIRRILTEYLKKK